MKFLQKDYRKPALSKAFKTAKSIFVRVENKVAKISLFDLPADSVRVKLKKEFREEIFSRLLKEKGSFSKIAESAGLNRGQTARRYFVERSGMPLVFLIKIAQKLKISEKMIQQNVTELRSIKSKELIKNPKLPFKITPDIALVIGGVLGDGGIEKKKCRVWYFNNEKQQIESFIKATRNTFGEVSFAFHRSISGTPCVIFPKIIGIILKTTGLKDGNKNYQNTGIPKILLNSKDKKIKISLLQRLFDDDGTVSNHHSNRCVSFTSPKITNLNEKIKEPKILLELKEILNQFEIKSRICIAGKNIKENGEITRNWEIRVTGKENLQKFYGKIGFGLERKQTKLKAVLDRYVEGLEFFPRNEAKNHYITLMKKLCIKKIELNVKNVSKFCKRNDRHVREVLLTLTKEGLVSRHLIGNKFVYKVIE